MSSTSLQHCRGILIGALEHQLEVTNCRAVYSAIHDSLELCRIRRVMNVDPVSAAKQDTTKEDVVKICKLLQ